ncbi:AAA family ATPase [candidate division KSB1 bacterium]|nr:AAA family ATPase [candidate division KSB1 bacterium]
MLLCIALIKNIIDDLHHHAIVGIIGARQVGKTTLARQILESTQWENTFYDLENPQDIARLADPMLGVQDKKGLVVIDEVQRYPEIFQVLWIPCV